MNYLIAVLSIFLTFSTHLYSQGTYPGSLPVETGGKSEIAVISVASGAFGNNAKEALSLLDELNPSETEAVIVQINWFIDSGWEALSLAMQKLANLDIPTYAFVDAMAVDAGAVIALATDHIYMAPASIIGGSPILGDGNMRVKQSSFGTRVALSVAQSKGHDTELVEGIWNEELEIVRNGITLSKKGSTLMLEVQEATLMVDGKPLLAEGVVLDVYELKEKAGLKGELTFLNAQDPHAWQKSSAFDSFRTREESYAGKVVQVNVGKDDLINSARFDFMRRVLMKADQEEAEAIIINLNTPGGLAFDTTEFMIRTMAKLKTPTYAYVNPSAASAGALIALAADDIYMNPVSAIGAAAVVSPMGEIEDDIVEKLNAVMVPLARSVARLKGHDPLYAERFIVPEKRELTEEEAELIESDKLRREKLFREEAVSLLTLASHEAVAEFEGRPALAKGTAKSIEDLMAQEGISGPLIEAKPLGFELIAQWITRFAGIILLVAIAAAYFEMKAPGFGIAGFTSMAAFTLFFFGHFVAGRLVGFEMVAIFVIGVALILVEIFIFPGTLVAGVLGFLCIIVSLLHTMADKKFLPSGEISAWAIEWESLGHAGTQLAIAILGSSVLIILFGRYFTELPLFRRLTLQTAPSMGPAMADPFSDSGSSQEFSIVPSRIGQRGESITALRPSGKARFTGRVLDVTTEGEFVDRGKPVAILEANSARIVVREVRE